MDVLLGDLTWETAYSLPGEGLPPRVVAEVTLEWPTWSQTAYRLWCIGEPGGDAPEINVEVLVRVQRLAETPDPAVVRDARHPAHRDHDALREPLMVGQVCNMSPCGQVILQLARAQHRRSVGRPEEWQRSRTQLACGYGWN